MRGNNIYFTEKYEKFPYLGGLAVIRLLSHNLGLELKSTGKMCAYNCLLVALTHVEQDIVALE